MDRGGSHRSGGAGPTDPGELDPGTRADLAMDPGSRGSWPRGQRLGAAWGPSKQLLCSVLFVLLYCEHIKKQEGTKNNVTSTARIDIFASGISNINKREL